MFAQTLTTAAPSASREAATRVFSDEALIRQIAHGNKLAMRALFARHQVRVYRYALRIVRDTGLAEDVVSDVFFDAWQHAGRFEGRSTVSTWLLGIARHKALTACSRRKNESIDEAALNVADPASNQEAELAKKDTAKLIRRCLSELSPEHAEIIDLVYYQEKSIKEIVEILSIPENTVKTRMFYARKRLAVLMTAQGVDRAA